MRSILTGYAVNLVGLVSCVESSMTQVVTILSGQSVISRVYIVDPPPPKASHAVPYHAVKKAPSNNVICSHCCMLCSRGVSVQLSPS
uniref:Secreted protein n=1 Tax=Cyprinus carpio TaxID=7962 RepID=A0A8C1IN78_CYPCA